MNSKENTKRLFIHVVQGFRVVFLKKKKTLQEVFSHVSIQKQNLSHEFVQITLPPHSATTDHLMFSAPLTCILIHRKAGLGNIHDH